MKKNGPRSFTPYSCAPACAKVKTFSGSQCSLARQNMISHYIILQPTFLPAAAFSTIMQRGYTRPLGHCILSAYPSCRWPKLYTEVEIGLRYAQQMPIVQR